MKRLIIGIIILLGAVGVLSSCDEQYTTYDGPAYVMFSDTLSICPALQDERTFAVNIASTRACDYDRTYAVEIMAQQSTAVYNRHYVLETQTVTIPAGKTAAPVDVRPIYENIDPADSLGIQLRLVSQLKDEWSEKGSITKIRLQKVCPFDINDFTGYCRMSSAFLLKYTGEQRRTFYCERIEGEPNMLLMRNIFCDGYDLKIKFDDSDPLNLKISFVEEQVCADTREIFGMIYGDGRILVDNVPGYDSEFDACQRAAALCTLLRVEQVGIIGAYVNMLEWIEEHEI